MLNQYNGSVTFLLQMRVVTGVEDAASWILKIAALLQPTSLKKRKLAALNGTYRLTKTRRLSSRFFQDSEGALTRVQNLMSSPIAAEWMDRFEIESLTVLGQVSGDLQEALSSMVPDIRVFAGGFNKT